MGGKQSTAARSRGPFPGVSTDDSAVPPPGGAPHFGHYRTGGGAMGLRSRSVSSVAGMGMDPSTAGGVPFGLYTPASRGTGDSERAPSGGGSTSDSTYAHGNGYQETGGGHHRDGMLYLGSRASLADALPLHIAPRWFSSHSGFKCPICSKSVASDEMEMHFIMCLSKPRLSYNDDVLTKDAGECVICLEELLQGDTIARLPCLCIYHKRPVDPLLSDEGQASTVLTEGSIIARGRGKREGCEGRTCPCWPYATLLPQGHLEVRAAIISQAKICPLPSAVSLPRPNGKKTPPSPGQEYTLCFCGHQLLSASPARTVSWHGDFSKSILVLLAFSVSAVQGNLRAPGPSIHSTRSQEQQASPTAPPTHARVSNVTLPFPAQGALLNCP
ncbi:E3 ubiquitin-protein ligase ZNRF1 [Sigmodon hispidus]